jgi:hypothetical protein
MSLLTSSDERMAAFCRGKKVVKHYVVATAKMLLKLWKKIDNLATGRISIQWNITTCY